MPKTTDHALTPVAPTERVTALRRERERLLRNISAKKKEIQRASTKTEAAERKIRERIGSLMSQYGQLQLQVHALFGELLNDGAISKRKLPHVRRLYEDLQAHGLLERQVDEQPVDEGGYSADKPASQPDSESLRAVLKRLAVSLHPDRVQLEAEKERRTRVMKDVTAAYEAGDLARLLELETQTLPADGGSALRNNDQLESTLARTVRELKAQLRSLQSELMRWRRSDGFRSAQELERAMRRGEDPLAAVIQETQQQLELLRELRAVAAQLQSRSMTPDWSSAIEPLLTRAKQASWARCRSR